MPYTAADTAGIYPPMGLTLWPAAVALTLLAAAVAGYYLVRRIRRSIAARRRQRLAAANRPRKDEIIRRALSEIARVKAAVQGGTLAADEGARQISLTARTCYDTLTARTTVYQARYEVAQQALHLLEQMLGTAYPAEFTGSSGQAPAAGFNVLCDQATQVVQSCI